MDTQGCPCIWLQQQITSPTLFLLVSLKLVMFTESLIEFVQTKVVKTYLLQSTCWLIKELTAIASLLEEVYTIKGMPAL